MVRIHRLATNVNRNHSPFYLCETRAATSVSKMEELSNAVGSNYVIVKSIIKHMTWREAEVAEKVCELWQGVVKELRKTELHVQHFRVIYSYEEPDSVPLTSFMTSTECFGIPELLITFQREYVGFGPFRCPLDSCSTRVDELSRICSYCTKNERRLICFNLFEL